MSFSTTQLDAVNQMMTGIGQAPVSSLDESNPEIATALSILNAVNREVQGEGWSFNTEINYPFMPDASGNIIVPDNVLQLSDNKISNVQKYQTVLRGGKLYDKISHSFTFPIGTAISCDVIWMEDFNDLPQVFKDYVTIRATRVMYDRTAGSIDAVKFKVLTQDEAYLRANCLAYDTQTAEPNIFGVESGQNFYISYTPFRAIAR